MQHIAGLETGRVVLRDKAGVEVPRQEPGMGQQRGLERNIARYAANHETVQRLAHHRNRLRPVLPVHDQLGDHRVVKHRDLTAVLYPRIHPHTVPMRGVGRKHGLRRRRKTHQAPGAGQEVAKRVFGVDTAFDGPAVTLDLRLRQWQWLARSDPDHELHQIQPGDTFSHRVFYLEPGVHLQEIKALVPADHKFHRARALVAHRLGQRHRLLAHGTARSVADKRAGRFLDHFLVPALDRALALVEVDHVALAVAHELDLDMPWLLDKLLHEHPVVAKAVARLVAAAGKPFERLLIVERHPQALAAAAGAGLDHDRVTDAFGYFDRAFGRFYRLVDARYAIHAGRQRELLGRDLVAHGGDRIVLGADEDQAFVLHAFGKFGVFAQKAIAGMDSLGAALLAGGDDALGHQVTLAAGRRAYKHRFVGQRHMARIAVGVGIHGHGLDAHLAGRFNDPAGDFTSIGDENLVKHMLLPSR